MKPWMKRMAKWVGYPLFFLFVFLLFAYWTFPWDRVRDYVVQEVEQPMRSGRRVPSGFELEIVDLSPSWVTGVELTGVRLVKLPTEADERPVDVTFERLHARVGLLAALAGDLEVDFEAVVAGGDVSGHFEQSGEDLAFDVALESVNLRRISLLRAYLPLPMQGKLGGSVALALGERPNTATGAIDLRIEGVKVGDGQAKLAVEGLGDGVTVDEIDAGDLRLEAAIEDGVLNVRRLQGRGTDLEVDGSGEFRLMRPFELSRADVLLRLNFSDAYKEKSDRTRALFSLLELQPRLRSFKTSDGALQLRVAGTLAGRVTTRGAGSEPAPGAD